MAQRREKPERRLSSKFFRLLGCEITTFANLTTLGHSVVVLSHMITNVEKISVTLGFHIAPHRILICRKHNTLLGHVLLGVYR